MVMKTHSFETKFYLGKKPARPGAVKFKLNDYLDYSAIKVPKSFGHVDNATAWNTLGNTVAGDCVVAGSAHETMLWTGASNPPMAQFTEQGALDIYKKFSGWNGVQDDPSDTGCDMVEFANYRLKTGIPDAQGKVHKITGYAGMRTLDQAMAAAYVFGAIGIGFRVPQSAETQFSRGQVWQRVAGSGIVGEHYVPVVGRNSRGMIICITWGRLQAMTPDFFSNYVDEMIAFISPDYLSKLGVTPEALNMAQLVTDLRALGGGYAVAANEIEEGGTQTA
jgi:hypothetical protein